MMSIPIVVFITKKRESWFDRGQNSIALRNFSVAESGTTIFLQVTSGYYDGAVCEIYPKYEDNSVFIDFEISWKKDEALPEIAVDVPEGCDSVYFSRGENRYKLVLEKDQAGQWQSADNRYIFTERNFET